MPSIDSGLATKVVAGLVTRPAVWRSIQRCWYRLCYRCALGRFRSLDGRIEGVREQERTESVNPAALALLAADLEALSVYPPAIRGERVSTQLRHELTYLWTCTGSADHLSLNLARKRFRKGAALSNSDWTKDALGEEWDRLSR